MEITKEILIGKSIDADILGKELTEATGITCTVKSHEPGLDADGLPDETTARLIFVFASQPDDATVDAAIAVHPVTLEGVTGTFAVSAGAEYLLREEIVQEGESIVLDVHVHTIFGDAASFSAEFEDWYAMGNRVIGGAVQTTSSGSVSLGNVPGQRVKAVGTASTIKVLLIVQRDGTLTIMKNDIEIESRGKAPTP